MQLLSHFLSNIILNYDLGCIKFGRLVGFKVNKIIFMLICAIKLLSNHSQKFKIGTVFTL